MEGGLACKAGLGIDIILLLEERYAAAADTLNVLVSGIQCAFVHEGGILKAPQAWKQRVKQCGSFPLRTSRSFLGFSGYLERMCWM